MQVSVARAAAGPSLYARPTPELSDQASQSNLGLKSYMPRSTVSPTQRAPIRGYRAQVLPSEAKLHSRQDSDDAAASSDPRRTDATVTPAPPAGGGLLRARFPFPSQEFDMRYGLSGHPGRAGSKTTSCDYGALPHRQYSSGPPRCPRSGLRRGTPWARELGLHDR